MSVDLTVTYLGLQLHSPLVASAGPHTRSLDNLRRLEDAGIGAVVLPSLFEEQLIAESTNIDALVGDLGAGFAETSGFYSEDVAFATGPDEYLELLAGAKAALSVPVIASLNGISASGWTHYASLLQEAGADALELNEYRIAADPDRSAADVEAEVLDVIEQVRQAVSIPIAVKLGPYFTSLPHLVRRIEKSGASGLVLFNRFYQPDLDLESLRATPALVLSTSADLRLPLRWIGLLRHLTDLSLALSSGVHTAEDAIKSILVGADAVMMTSALLHHGAEHVATVQAGMQAWFDEHEYESVDQARGSAAWATGPDPTAFERANYLTVLTSYT
jgi:dihydroorotate dehydrogenase (fumarate)